MKGKSIKEVLKNGNRTSVKARFGYQMEKVTQVEYGNGLYLFPEQYEKKILGKKTDTGEPAKSVIDKRCKEIQKWLVRMRDNKDALNIALRYHGIPYDKLRKFAAHTTIKWKDVTPFSVECGIVAMSIVPKAWVKQNK